MKKILITFFFVLFSEALFANTGQILTEIGSIPDNLTIRLASKPELVFRPSADGQYTFAPADKDYVLILPEEGDKYIYSPRIIPAGAAGADTLYIIPPTMIEYTIVVDNFTDLNFTFHIDRAIISEALETAKKDYQLEIMPQRKMSTIRIAAIAEGYPAVIKSVSILQNQRRGYMQIAPADLGIKPLAVKTPPATVNLPPVIEEPVDAVESTLPPVIEETRPPEIVKVEKTLEPEPATPPIVEEVAVTIPPAKVNALATAIQEVASPQPEVTSEFFNNRIIFKTTNSFLISASGEYALISNSEKMSTMGASIGIHNIALLQQKIDIYAHAAQSPDLDGRLYEGSFIWTPSEFAAIDVTHHRASASAWENEYFVSRTSLGLNGKYLLAGNFGQFGVGARFRLDFGDFEKHVESAVESRTRYLPSFYLITLFNLDKSSLGFLLGAVNESGYFNATYLLQNKLGLSYTFKSSSQADELLSPLEQHQQHKVGLSYYFSISTH